MATDDKTQQQDPATEEPLTPSTEEPLDPSTEEPGTGEPAKPAEPSEPEKDYKKLYEDTLKHSREWEKRAKANKKALDAALADDTTANDLTEQVDALKAELAQKDIELLRASVASETGVPVSLLVGTTADELKASADAVLEFAKVNRSTYPVDKGGAAGSTPVSRESIESIKDPLARIRARAEHADLYRND